MGDDGDHMGTPAEVEAAYEQFRAGTRPRPPTPEEEAALSLAIEMSDAETRAFIAENRDTAMAASFPDELREEVLRDFAEVMALAAALEDSWRQESEPADLLASARGIRDAAAALATTVERLWPNRPPLDYSRDVLGDG